MRATVLYGAGDVRIENVPDARPIEPTDAVVTLSHAAKVGSGKTLAVVGDGAVGLCGVIAAQSRRWCAWGGANHE